MPLPAALIALAPYILSGLVGLGGNIGTNRTNRKIAENTNETNLQMTRETNELNERLWREQLEYNDPTNQMMRLKNAGINPVVAYGGMQNSAPTAPTMQAPSVDPYQVDYTQLGNLMLDSTRDVGGMQQNLAQNKKVREEVRSLKIDNDLNESLFVNNVIKSYQELKGLGLTNKKLEEDVKLIQEQVIEKQLANTYDFRTLDNRVKEVALNVENKEVANEIQKFQKEITKIESEWKEKNMKLDYKGKLKQIEKLETEIGRALNAWHIESMTANDEIEIKRLEKELKSALSWLAEEEKLAYQSLDQIGSNGKIVDILKNFIPLIK
jgi:hypothetical protein